VTARKFRVLLADDHVLVREGLKRLIDDQPDMVVVAEASDGPEALRLCETAEVDVALVDVSMPTWDGVKTAQALRSACPQMKIVSVTRHDDETFVRRMFAAGANGYVLKQSPSNRLTSAIRAAMRGEACVDSSVRRVETVAPPAGVPISEVPEESEPLTDIERKVIQLVSASHSGREISEQLGMDVDTVQTLKIRAMSKLGLQSRVHLIEYARRQRWLRDSDK